jgi:4-aminobutyrate aminotransferase
MKKENISSTMIRKKHDEYLLPCVANYYQEPLVLTRGEGKYVYDADGNQYKDFFCGILTTMLGHSHPEVNKRAKEQIDNLQHVSTLYQTIPMVRLAEKMAQITPGPLKKSFFTNSGTEANETAVMMARKYTGCEEVISLRHAYSGRSSLAMSLTGHSTWRQPGASIPGIRHALSPYCYRCPLHLRYPECDVACADDIEELILTTTSGKVACFLAEPIQGVGGFITPPPEYFKKAVEIVHRFGGLFIADEVQTGFGRTGSTMFGIEHWEIEPDIMTFAKGFANGFPIGGTIAAEKVADSMTGLSISTFGGNPVSCSAALATIEVVENEHLAENAARVGSYFFDKLSELQKKYPCMGDIRGKGLMIGIEIVRDNRDPDPETVLKIFEMTKKKRLLIGKGGLFGNVLRITPPLNINNTDVDEAVVVIDEVLGSL